MRRLVLSAATLATLATPALAQTDTAAAPAAPASCAELATELGIFQTTGQSEMTDTATGCHFTNIFIVPASPSRFKVDELTLVAPGVLADYAALRVPAEVDLTLKGVLLSPETGSELTTYMIESQSEPMEVHLAYRWDRDAGTIELADLSVSAGEDGGFRMSGRFSDAKIEPNSFEDMAQMPGKLDEFTLEIDNARFAAAYFVPPLIGQLPFDQDPRALVAGYIDAVNAFIAALPSAHVSNDSKAALTSFVSAFPRPRGDYTIALRADPGLALGDLAIQNAADLAGLLSRVTITATHAKD